MSTFTLTGKVLGYSRGGTKGGREGIPHANIILDKVKRYGRKVIESCGVDAQCVGGKVAYNRVLHFKVRARHMIYNILIGCNLRSLLIGFNTQLATRHTVDCNKDQGYMDSRWHIHLFLAISDYIYWTFAND